MPSRSLLLVAIVILAVTVPFLLGEKSSSSPSPSADPGENGGENGTTRLTSLWQRVVGGADDSASSPNGFAPESARAVLAENEQLRVGVPVNAHELSGMPGVSLPDALRFDVTPAWVSATWPRITPQRLENGWYGLRVPLVTGTETEDVAGSLTYYFNSQNYVERVTLYGYTGDSEPLISFVQQQYGLRPYAAVGRGLFLSFFETVPIGVLQIEDAAVHSPESQRARFRVELELNLPRPGAMLSDEVMQKLRRLHEAKLL